jgi:hypothetical protein
MGGEFLFLGKGVVAVYGKMTNRTDGTALPVVAEVPAQS